MTAYMIASKGRDLHDKLRGRGGHVACMLHEFMKPGELGIVEHGENMLYYMAGGDRRPGMSYPDEAVHDRLKKIFKRFVELGYVNALTEVEFIHNTDKFTWGKPVGWTEVGNIDILEIQPFKPFKPNERDTEGNGVVDEEADRKFHGFIDGRGQMHSYCSLDSAVVGTIGIKREGLNGHAAMYFEKMTS